MTTVVDTNVRRFEGRVAVVTGGSRGIGAAVARRLAGEGARVVVAYREAEDDAATVVDDITTAGGEALAVQVDVTDEASVRALVRQVVRATGGVDILVANAGAVRDQLVGAMTLEQWETVVDTNLLGPFLCIREVLPFMMRKRAGTVVCISSIAAVKAGRGHVNYVASKGGINAMVKSLAVELAPKNIRVNAVAPGVILTEMSERVRHHAGDVILDQIPLKRFGVPDDVARAVCFVASDEADYITGEILHVTGGFGL
jgi:3-oxoacyl-[acyl-carrier protein] reductase